MARKLSVDLELSTQGYVASIREAKNATADYTTAVGVSNNTIKSLNREVKKAQQEATGLAQAFHALSEEQRNSAGGQAMARQLEDAKKYAAQLYDVAADTRQEIKNMASDTASWDAMKQGIDVAKSATMAYAGAIAKLTGNEEDLKGVITTLTMIEGGFNTVIKIGNALQEQSALMIGLRRLGLVKSTTATIAATAATTAETAATEGATVAQAKFNAVAALNPYVLIATAAIAAAGAIAYFAVKAATATTEAEKFHEEVHQMSMDAIKDAQSEIVKLDLLFNKINDVNASLADRTDAIEQVQSLYPAYFAAFSKEAILAGEASAAYQQLKDDIIAVAIARGAQDKMTEKSKDLVDALQKQKEAQEAYNKAVEADKKQQATSNHNPVNGPNVAGMTSGLKVSDAKNDLNDATKAVDQLKGEIGELQEYVNGAGDAMKRMAGNTEPAVGSLNYFRNRASALQKQLDDGLIPKSKIDETKKEIADCTKQADALEKKLHPAKGGSVGAVDTKAVKESLTDLEKSLSDLQSKYKDGLKPGLSKEEYLKQVDDLKKKIEQKKIELGLELPPNELQIIDKKIADLKAAQLNVETRLDPKQYQEELKKLEKEKHEVNIALGYEVAPSKIQELQKQLSDKEIELQYAPDENAVESITKDIKDINQAIYSEKIRLHPELDPNNTVQKDVNELVESIKKPKIEFDFSGLTKETGADEAQTDFSNFEAVQKKMQEYQSNIAGGGMQEQLDAWNEGLASLIPIYDELIAKCQEWGDASAKANEANDRVKEIQKHANGLGQSLNSVSSAFNGLAQATGKKEFNIAGTIAQAIASVALGYATATAQASEMGPWVWIAFALAGLATMISTIAAIKQQTAGSFAQGGTIGGHSYYGDKLLAHVNSGETILTEKQTKSLYDELGSRDRTPMQMQTSVTTVGVEGSELILAIQNTLKENGQTSIL